MTTIPADLLPMPVAILAPDGTCYINNAFVTRFAVERAHPQPTAVLHRIFPEIHHLLEPRRGDPHAPRTLLTASLTNEYHRISCIPLDASASPHLAIVIEPDCNADLALTEHAAEVASLQQSLALYRSLTRYIPGAEWSWSTATQRLTFSEKLAQMFPQKWASPPTHLWEWSYRYAVGADELGKLFRGLLEGKRTEGSADVVLYDENGQPHYHTIYGRGIGPGSQPPSEILGYLHDTTRAANLTYDLQRLELIAEAAQRAATAAHDIRNKLTPIQGFAQLAHDGDENSAREAIEVACAETPHIVQLCEEVMATCGGRPPPRTPLDLNTVIRRECTHQNKRFYPRASATVILHDKPLYVLTSHTDISRILTNLYSNAVEAFADVKATVEVTISLSPVMTTPETPSTFCLLTFTDNGPGIPQHVVERYESAPITTKLSGHGLGLRSIMQIAHDIGGTFTIGRVNERGTRATITLPLLPPP